eukprot:6101221-Pleurochrysis_carterae.AAC.1
MHHGQVILCGKRRAAVDKAIHYCTSTRASLHHAQAPHASQPEGARVRNCSETSASNITVRHQR